MQLKEVKLSKSTGFQLKEAAVQIVRVHSFHSLGAKTTKAKCVKGLESNCEKRLCVSLQLLKHGSKVRDVAWRCLKLSSWVRSDGGVSLWSTYLYHCYITFVPLIFLLWFLMCQNYFIIVHRGLVSKVIRWSFAAQPSLDSYYEIWELWGLSRSL